MPNETTTSIAQLKRANWDTLQVDVASRIRLLRSTVMRLEDSATSDAIARDLILPNLALLAEFCENVSIDKEAMQ
jgi:hypothetical protein